MKRIFKILHYAAFVSVLLFCRAENWAFPILKGPYLGQQPPGMTPELFAPGIVSTGSFEHSSPVFIPNLQEIYWSTQLEENGKDVAKPIYFMKMINGVWTKPEIPMWAKEFICTENPFISPDGKRLYFMASDSLHPVRADIYYVQRVGNKWSAPVNLGEPINTPGEFEGQPTVANNATIYYIGNHQHTPAGFGLYCSRMEKGKYQPPIFMDQKFNSLEVDWTPYIAPDESYFIFCSFRKGGYGSGDLYICFKQKDGSWGNIINMGDKINTSANERFPNVTPDGKYLFFNSTKKIQGADASSPGNGKGDIYWIDAKIIEELKPKE